MAARVRGPGAREGEGDPCSTRYGAAACVVGVRFLYTQGDGPDMASLSCEALLWVDSQGASASGFSSACFGRSLSVSAVRRMAPVGPAVCAHGSLGEAAPGMGAVSRRRGQCRSPCVPFGASGWRQPSHNFVGASIAAVTLAFGTRRNGMSLKSAVPSARGMPVRADDDIETVPARTCRAPLLVTQSPRSDSRPRHVRTDKADLKLFCPMRSMRSANPVPQETNKCPR